MQIGKLAELAEVKVSTIRFYERSGLMPEPERKQSGYRIYGQRDLQRLRFIRQAQDLGFSLTDIRDILGLRERGQPPCGSVIALAERHLEETDRRIQSLKNFRRALAQAVTDWKTASRCSPSPSAICGLIEHATPPHAATDSASTNSLARRSPGRRSRNRQSA